MVYEYYCHDDISRQAPGKRDYVTVWKSDGKERLQKRHLYFSLGEAFALFVEEYPSIQIGKSKFAELRPANVLLQKDTPKEACLCVYHESIVLLCEALHQALPEFPLFTSRFVDNFVCSSSLESCMFGSCKECKGKTNWWFQKFEGEALNTQIFWKQWGREEVSNEDTHLRKKARKHQQPGQGGRKKKVEKRYQNGTIGEAMDILSEKIPSFLITHLLKEHKATIFS